MPRGGGVRVLYVCITLWGVVASCGPWHTVMGMGRLGG